MFRINFDSKLQYEKGDVAPGYKLGHIKSNKECPVYKVVPGVEGN